MPLAATHIITTTAALGSFRSKYFNDFPNPKYFAFYSALGSLLPDIDIPLGWFFRSMGFIFSHGTLTHTLFFAVLFLLFSALLAVLHKKYLSQIFLIFFFGILIHLVLDYVLGGGAKEGVAWFYPFSSDTYKIHILFLLPFKDTFESLDALVLLCFFYANSPFLSAKR